MGDCCNAIRLFLFHNHCYAHIYGSGTCSRSQARARLESVFSPETVASVMARPGTMCIPTVTVLVILTAAVQSGEHKLPASICTCTSLCQCKKSVCIQSEAACYLPEFFLFFFFFFFHHENGHSNVSCRQCWARHGGC